MKTKGEKIKYLEERKRERKKIEIQHDLDEIVKVEKKKALKRLIYDSELTKLKTYLTVKDEHYQEEEIDDETRIYVDYARGNRAIVNKLQKRGETHLYHWITISPPPVEGLSISEQIKKYQTYFKHMENKPTVAGGYWSIEFGQSEEHVHAHFWLKQNADKAYADGRVYEKHGDTCLIKKVQLMEKKTHIAFDVKVVKETPESFDYLRRYLQGDKDDEEKMLSVETDIILREKYGLELYYQFGEEFWEDY